MIFNPVYAQEGKIMVLVIDKSGNPVKGAKVSIDKGKTYQTSTRGTFSFTPLKKLEMPFNVKAEKPNYKIEEFVYLEQDRQIEIIMSRMEKPIKIFVLNPDKSPVSGAQVLIEGNSYTGDKDGRIIYIGEMPEQSSLEIQNHDVVTFNYLKKDHKIIVIAQKREEVPQNVDSLYLDSLNAANLIEEKPNTFNQYKIDFEKIAQEIIEEKVLLEKKNLEISQQIEKIKDRLKRETDLTAQERLELQSYLEHLDGLLVENNIAFNKAEEKTKNLIYQLKMVIMAKDSINYQTKLQMEKAEKERQIAEARSKRNLLIFSVAAAVFLVSVLVFYFVTMRMRKQKKAVEKANLDLKLVKDELLKNVVEVKKQNRLIEEQNMQLDTFVYKASHDIKGPLRSIIGLTQTGIKSIKDPDSLEFFDHIHRSTLKLDNLLADLLQLTKAKQADVEKVDVNVLSLVKDCMSSFANLEEYKTMKFNLNIPSDITLFTDDKLFYSITQNFIENGIKYKDDKKPESFLNITARKEGNKFIIEFADNGLGIDSIHQWKIFEMFYKVDPTSLGTGLGLHIVKLNIEKLNGTVTLKSSVGEGSVFTVTMNI